MPSGGKRRAFLGLALVLLLAFATAGVPARASSPAQTQHLPPRPLVFVHGYCGTGDDWLRPEKIRTRLVEEYGYDPEWIEIFYYPPGQAHEDNRGDIAEIARGFAQTVEAFRQRVESLSGQPVPQVDVVAHSMGAVVVRYAMAHYLDRSHPPIGRLISVAGANNGSIWALVKEGEIFCLSGGCQLPLEVQLLAYSLLLSCSGLTSFCCWLNPIDQAAQQLIPAPLGSFLRALNQPQNSPPAVDYHCLYGNIVGTLEVGFFDWSRKISIEGLGDAVVGPRSATEIPGIGRLGESHPNYHTYEFRSEVHLRTALRGSCQLFGQVLPYCYGELALDVQTGKPYPLSTAMHGGLVESGEVAALIDRILRSTPSPETPVPTLPALPPAAGKTATVLIVDVSGSMGDAWQGGIKLASAVDAASRVVRLIEHENQVAGAQHRVALVGFSTDAWVDVPLGSDTQAVLDALEAYGPQDRTNIGAALQLANRELASVPPEEGRHIILLTDGMTNEGLSPQEILHGPVAEAAAAGVCIHTIGFGDPGDLDEAFLQQIAQATPCGGYAYASDGRELAKIYVRLRHTTTGSLLAEYEGTVTQGQEIDVGVFEVPPGRGELVVTLDWPGSTLDLLLYDPQGRLIDENYPGVQFFRDLASIHLLIQNPPAGQWRVGVKGVDVPTGTTFFYLAVSTRGEAVIQSTGGTPAWVALLLFFAVVTGMVIGIALRGHRSGAFYPVLLVAAGFATPPQLVLGTGRYRIGSAPGNALTLYDPSVSPEHAEIMHYYGRFLVADLAAPYGTWLNGARLYPAQWYPLRDGDRIRLGNCELVFRERGG